MTEHIEVNINPRAINSISLHQDVNGYYIKFMLDNETFKYRTENTLNS